MDTGSAREGEAACPEKVGLDTEGFSFMDLWVTLAQGKGKGRQKLLPWKLSHGPGVRLPGL